jgi:hypothetical protein
MGDKLVIGSRAGNALALDPGEGRVLPSSPLSGGGDSGARYEDVHDQVHDQVDDQIHFWRQGLADAGNLEVRAGSIEAQR